MEIEGLQAAPPVELPNLAAQELVMEHEGRQADPPAEPVQLREGLGRAAAITQPQLRDALEAEMRDKNWPMNQVVLKVGAALAAGCTMVLKPSEIAPMSSILFAEIMHEAGVPAGVFNMVNGDGVGVGSILSAHPEIDVVSFTGSTRAGILISKAAADTVKTVSLELGGKSPNLVFADSDLDAAVERGVHFCFSNTGQSCNAATRMLVERSAYDRAVEVAAATAEATLVDLPSKSGGHIGPLVSQAQFDKVQGLIQTGIDEGARLVAGGVGRPEDHRGDGRWSGLLPSAPAR